MDKRDLSIKLGHLSGARSLYYAFRPVSDVFLPMDQHKGEGRDGEGRGRGKMREGEDNGGGKCWGKVSGLKGGW